MPSTSDPIRIGMLTPSSNTCLEPMTYRLLQGIHDVTVHFSRVRVTAIRLDEETSAQFDTTAMVKAAELLADAKVDVLVWNGTSGSWLGVEQDRAIVQALEEATRVPATTSTLALLDAFAVYGVTRLGLATPYTADINEEIAKTYAAEGIEVVTEDHLGISDNESFGRVTSDEVAAQVRRVTSDVHAAAVVCTNVHGAAVAADLERETGVPVLDSVAATLWKSLQLVDHTRQVTGYGTLLRDGFLRARLQQVCAELLDGTGADRTTLRLDIPEHGLHVDLTAAECLRAGVRSIRHEGSLDQRALNTVVWLEQNRQNLVQPHFHGDPTPPQALIDVYGVKAQLLGPVEGEAAMVGWLSAHSMRERGWTDRDVAAMDNARAGVQQILGLN